MTVYTYYDSRIRIGADQRGLLSVWQTTWKRNGWEPRVLTPKHAEKHSMYSEFVRHMKAFPSSNPDGYDLACFVRWMAFVEVGGGWITDYDVMNHSFAPRAPRDHVEMLDSTYVPCAVGADLLGAVALLQTLVLHEPKKNTTHVSDMLVFKEEFDNRTFGEPGKECVEFGVRGWDSAPLVHFPAGKCTGFPDKVSAIRSAKRA